MRLFKISAICIFAIILPSCIDVEEEVWINADSSSKMSMDITIPLSAKRTLQKSLQDLKTTADKTDGASLDGPHIKITEDGRANGKFSLEFSSVLAARRFSENLPPPSEKDADSPASAILGKFHLEISQMAAKVDRKIFTTKLLPLKNTSPAVAALNRKRLNGASLDYTLHLPNPPLESNAQIIKNDGKTLKWSFLLADHLDQDANIQLIWRPVIPWWAWLVITSILSLLIYATVKVVNFAKIRLRKRRKPSA